MEIQQLIKRLSLKYILMAALLIMATAAIGFGPSAGTTPATDEPPHNRLAKVVMKVDGMSCGGCVSTIQSSLSGFDGVTDVRVDVAAGTTVVIYDSGKISNVQELAQALTASGYPATVTHAVTADQLKREKQIAVQKSRSAIAAVGNLEIARSDFEAEIKHARNRYAAIYGPTVMEGAQGQRLMDNLKRQVAQRLIVENIQLQEIQRAGYRIDPADQDQAFEDYLREQNLSREAFTAELKKNGMALDYFTKRFHNRVLINRYIDEKIIPANISAAEKKQRYADWFANARLLAEITFFDAEIERLVNRPSTGGSCGSSCSTAR